MRMLSPRPTQSRFCVHRCAIHRQITLFGCMPSEFWCIHPVRCCLCVNLLINVCERVRFSLAPLCLRRNCNCNRSVYCLRLCLLLHVCRTSLCHRLTCCVFVYALRGLWSTDSIAGRNNCRAAPSWQRSQWAHAQPLGVLRVFFPFTRQPCCRFLYDGLIDWTERRRQSGCHVLGIEACFGESFE